MRKLVTAEQAQQLDHLTQTIQNVSAESLMERAGSKAASQLLKDFPQFKKIVVLVGPGNNGGDGLVIARELLRRQSKAIQLTLVCPEEGASPLWLKKKDELLSEFPFVIWVGDKGLDFLTSRPTPLIWDIMVDAAFGVGLSRPLSSNWQSSIRFLQQRSSVTIAIDIPSGLHGTTGLACEGVVIANQTYTMGFAKLGMLIGDGPSVCGRIKVLNIGFSDEAVGQLSPKIKFVGVREVLNDFPERASWNNHKSNRGHLLVIAGSEGMEGAGALAALAGARMGAGYVTWARWQQSSGYKVSVPPHIMSAILDSELYFLNKIKAPTAVVIGPGLGVSEQSERLIKNVLKKFSHLPVVIDADALQLLKIKNLYPVPKSWVLTPHAGELARLLDVKVDTINENRFQMLMRAKEQLGGSPILKGFRTMICESQREVSVIGAGGPVLAKAGTGDVLAGMIGGALARGQSFEQALRFAVYLHGRAGDLYVKKWKNDFTLVASDLPDLLPRVLKGLYGKRSS
ncbi:MAG: putative carbohydrate kinase [Pseudomonadota bacterium]|jgi:NAD(P)H-hydrate epimerase